MVEFRVAWSPAAQIYINLWFAERTQASTHKNVYVFCLHFYAGTQDTRKNTKRPMVSNEVDLALTKASWVVRLGFLVVFHFLFARVALSTYTEMCYFIICSQWQFWHSVSRFRECECVSPKIHGNDGNKSMDSHSDNGKTFSPNVAPRTQKFALENVFYVTVAAECGGMNIHNA